VTPAPDDVTDSILFDSYMLGDLSLPNRAVMAPMTRSRAVGSIPNGLMAEYYAQRASAGLIVSEGISPSPNGLGYPRIPGLWSDEQVAGWKVVTDAVHEAGGRIFAQLMHTGRVAHPANLPDGGRVIAPAAVPLEDTRMWVDEAGEALPIPVADRMEPQEVEVAISEYVHASVNAIEAGFDGVELHGANGYLIEQFIHPLTNRRMDSWGGSIATRCRFAIQTAEKVAEAIGGGRLGMRLSPYGVFNEMPHYDDIDVTYTHLARQLGAAGLTYLHIVDHSSQGAPEVPDEIKSAMREVFGGSFILSGGYDHERAVEDLTPVVIEAEEEGGDDTVLPSSADLVAFGRPYLANPDLLERFRRGAALNEPRTGLFYTPGSEGYTDYPTLGD
jgi:N-ethylmaleimide reductase